jgi:aminobenzoyl-glutamate utilization protein B
MTKPHGSGARWVLLAVCLVARPGASQDEGGLSWLRSNEPYLERVSRELHEKAEPAHHEFRTASYLKGELEAAGFEIESRIGNMPTAFVAEYGSGDPVLGIVALLDALPGLSEDRASHGCGHHLIAAADLGAVLAIASTINHEGLSGTLRFYGAPAEEIYHGGVYMVRAGVFDDVDALLFWHPSTVTTVIARSGLAMDSVRFVFDGLPTDATDAAFKGRNALSAAYRFAGAVEEAKHDWPEDSVVNHVLLEGGEVPSVVPARATLWYFIHGRDRKTVDALHANMESLASAIAEDTDTHLEVQVLSSTRHWLINRHLAEMLHRHLMETSEASVTAAERIKADALRAKFSPGDSETFFSGVLPLSYGEDRVPISDDTAEASWVTPRGGFLVACFPSSIPSHTREWAELGTSSFALQGMMRAARVLVRTGLELLNNPRELDALRRELVQATSGEVYVSPLPDGRGPFDYLPRPQEN